MDIEKVSEFAGEMFLNCRKSEAVHIGGLPWKIVAQINTNYRGIADNQLGFSLECDASKKDSNWSCECSATFRIVSQKCDGTENSTGNHFRIVFDTVEYQHGFGYYITFADLMDEGNGFYDESGDKVTLVIDLMMKESKTEKPEAFEDCFC
ncbi:hypothetical protein niasHS_004322 [Heterodera schachtii]|uniref:MATH domain-containing protein n=1 Tax=Heterodera schachtii TaxID=97005 RepID=A0ABD2K0W7_HETSC